MQKINTKTEPKTLLIDKTVIFSSPIEGGDVLVRTGVIQDNNKYYHSVLYAYSKQYINMNETDRKNIVYKLRSSISVKPSRNEWKTKESGNMTFKLSFYDRSKVLINSCYKYIFMHEKIENETVKSFLKKNKDDLRYIFDTIKLDIFDKKVFSPTFADENNKNIKELKDLLVINTNTLLNKYNDRKLSKLKKKMLELILLVVDESEELVYQQYVNGYQSNNKENVSINKLADKIDRNIFFIDFTTKLPYKMELDCVDRKSIIILKLNDNEYEVLGRLLSNNIVQRQFDFNDTLIQKIYTYLYKPSDIYKKYPYLLPYLPSSMRHLTSPSKDITTILGKSDSEVESRSESDSHSESPKKHKHKKRI